MYDIDTFKSKLELCDSVKSIADLYSTVIEQKKRASERVLTSEQINSLKSEIDELKSKREDINNKINEIQMKLYSDNEDFDESEYKAAMMKRIEHI